VRFSGVEPESPTLFALVGPQATANSDGRAFEPENAEFCGLSARSARSFPMDLVHIIEGPAFLVSQPSASREQPIHLPSHFPYSDPIPNGTGRPSPQPGHATQSRTSRRTAKTRCSPKSSGHGTLGRRENAKCLRGGYSESRWLVAAETALQTMRGVSHEAEPSTTKGKLL